MDPSHGIISAATDAASDELDELDPSSGTRLGDFTLLKRLGRGAQGEVYEARQESLGRLVALKVLPPYLTFSPERLRRFEQEARAGGRLDHPHAIGVHAVGEHRGYHYIAQELVAGGRTLADRIAQARTEAELPRDWFEKSAALFVHVAEAVHAAHEAGIVHRDIKPGNILLTLDGQPKVADFGLAMVVDDLHRSRSGELIGTPFYMSPEQAAGGRAGLDRRTDVFSLGTTLYELLTLRRPFEGETREKVVEAILLRDPPDPRKLRGSVPTELAVICMKALEKRRERRYQSAGELASDLNRYLRHEPIVAKPPGPVLRAGKWLRRHPVRTGFAAAFLLVAVLLVKAYRSDQEAGNQRDFALGRANLLHQTLNVLVASLLDPAWANVNAPLPAPPANDHYVGKIDEVVRIADTMKELPEERWYLLLVAGSSYRNVSLFDQAEANLTEALDLARQHAEHDPEATYQPDFESSYLVARSAYELGRLRWWMGDLPSAEKLLRESRDVALLRNDDNALGTYFFATMDLGQVLVASGRPAEAEAVYAELDARAWGDTADGELFAVQTRQALGQVILDQGRPDEAAELLVPLLDRAEPVYPPIEWVNLAVVVARLHDQRGRAAIRDGRADDAAREDQEAERLFQEGRARLAVLEPGGGPRTANLLGTYGSFMNQKQRGRIAEAVPVLEEGLGAALHSSGEDALVTLEVRNNLATAYYQSGRKPDAESQWRAILESDRRAPPNDLSPVLMALQNLSALCRNAKRYQEAEQLSRELVARTPASDSRLEDRKQKLEELEALLRAAPSNP